MIGDHQTPYFTGGAAEQLATQARGSEPALRARSQLLKFLLKQKVRGSVDGFAAFEYDFWMPCPHGAWHINIVSAHNDFPEELQVQVLALVCRVKSEARSAAVTGSHH